LAFRGIQTGQKSVDGLLSEQHTAHVTLDHVLTHFNGVADVYDEVLPFFATFAEETVRRLDPSPGAQVLDVAAGRGALTAQFLARGCAVTAVDGAPRMVELLREDFPQLPAHLMNAVGLDLPAESFDVVSCGFAMHIIPDPYAALGQIGKVLKPGGRFVMTVPGRPDGSDDPWPDPLVDLYAEYRRFAVHGVGRQSNDVEETDLFASSTMTDVTAAVLEISIPVPDGETYWRWSRSHGSGRFIDALSDEKRAEMHAALLDRMAELPGFVLRRSATMWTARKPG
jgi:ubiquinone/menaquinone biosynthesis C-methylase UbiE